jgi:hypothetical protein
MLCGLDVLRTIAVVEGAVGVTNRGLRLPGRVDAGQGDAGAHVDGGHAALLAAMGLALVGLTTLTMTTHRTTAVGATRTTHVTLGGDGQRTGLGYRINCGSRLGLNQSGAVQQETVRGTDGGHSTALGLEHLTVVRHGGAGRASTLALAMGVALAMTLAVATPGMALAMYLHSTEAGDFRKEDSV